MLHSEEIIKNLFEHWAGSPAENIMALPQAGSNRRYFRISGGGKQAVATYGNSLPENKAFVEIARVCAHNGVPVPAIYAVATDGLHYLQEDLGDTSLYSLLNTPEAPALLQQAMEQLAFMQVKGLQGFDYACCYPAEHFDRRSIFWDLNYFKYNFLKLTKIDFDEKRLEDDFETLAGTLLQADGSFFMYRDFQSRNVMVTPDGKVRFIDFQGGRCGPPAYDVASFLFQARANFDDNTRATLLRHYLNALEKLTNVDRQAFTRQVYTFAFFKGLQNLGTYGYRGLFEHKALFLQSIPQALANLRTLIDEHKLDHLSTGYLFELINNNYELQITNYELQRTGQETDCFVPRNDGADEANSSLITHHSSLLITVSSFSYKEGYPIDYSGNGGGFVFDCRGINNPGRRPDFSMLTGRDKAVMDYLETSSRVGEFLQHVFDTLDISVGNYIERGFTSLSVAFGCTGGQHRSVYCAEQTAHYLSKKHAVNIRLVHREQGIEQFIPAAT